MKCMICFKRAKTKGNFCGFDYRICNNAICKKKIEDGILLDRALKLVANKQNPVS